MTCDTGSPCYEHPRETESYMRIETVAILSPGDMGHAVGRALREHGLRVISHLEGRSQRTRELARQAGIEDTGSLEELVSEADAVLSILVPAEASGVAESVAGAISATGADTMFADCNAVSPATAAAMCETITRAGGCYVDGGIIGGPPAPGAPRVRIYVSGERAAELSALDCDGVAIMHMGGQVGRASAIKMCYAALTKGTSSLQLALLTTAKVLGVSDELAVEFASSQPAAFNAMNKGLPGLPSKAFRWIGEMEEIAATFDDAGVTPFFHKGAVEMYRLMSDTPFANETPETIDRSRTLDDTIAALADLLVAPAPASD